MLVGRLGEPWFLERLWKFVRKVDAFKQAAAGGELDGAAFSERLEAYRRYRREFSGRKRGARTAGEIDYQSWHGDVVDLLFEERRAAAAAGEGVFNSQLIDLFVMDGGHMTEIYEVKTSLGRQALYTAIGQLVTHSAPHPGAARHLVLPNEEELPPDFEAVVERFGIRIRRFRMDGSTTRLL